MCFFSCLRKVTGPAFLAFSSHIVLLNRYAISGQRIFDRCYVTVSRYSYPQDTCGLFGQSWGHTYDIFWTLLPLFASRLPHIYYSSPAWLSTMQQRRIEGAKIRVFTFFTSGHRKPFTFESDTLDGSCLAMDTPKPKRSLLLPLHSSRMVLQVVYPSWVC